MAEIMVFPGTEELIQEAAERFVRVARNAINRRGRFSVALSGGSTPRPLYALLGSEPVRSGIEWSGSHFFWGDERCVPPEDAQSNYRMARETLLRTVPVPAGQIHRIHGEDDPTEAASDYERELRTFFGAKEGGPPASFDLVLLGIGEDAHTCSLFPGSPAIAEKTRWTSAEFVQSVSMWRVTLTPVVLNASRNAFFLVSGAGKARAVHDVLRGPFEPERLPAQAIQPRKGKLVWLVDRAAAGALDR